MIIYIPIKQNSQRVPNKNFRLFNGKPLWEHTVDKFSDPTHNKTVIITLIINDDRLI